jgi:hypothetical protein
MNKKIVLSLFCILAFHQASAQDGNMSIQEIEDKLISRKLKLFNDLGKQIIKKEADISFLEQKKLEIADKIKNKLREKMMQENPEQLIIQNDLDDKFEEELGRFLANYFIEEKRGLLSEDQFFFKELLSLDEYNFFKFCFIKYVFDCSSLKAKLSEWQKLSNDLLDSGMKS